MGMRFDLVFLIVGAYLLVQGRKSCGGGGLLLGIGEWIWKTFVGEVRWLRMTRTVQKLVWIHRWREVGLGHQLVVAVGVVAAAGGSFGGVGSVGRIWLVELI